MPNAGTKRQSAGHVTLNGKVRKVIPAMGGSHELIEIVLEGGEPFYCEIRIPNTLRTTRGQLKELKPGDRVTLAVESS